MKTKLTAIVTALSIAVSGTTVTPAQAAPSERDVWLFLFGAVAGAVIANNTAATPAPAPRPVTFSTGPLNVRQTYSFDLDRGRVTENRNADIWFQALDGRRRYLKPINGAKIAVGDRTNRGYRGCSRATYTTRRVPLNVVPEGSYICVKTSQGRYSQFRINDIIGGRNKTLRLGYTTWQ